MSQEARCPICGGPGRKYAKVCALCHSWWRYHQLQTAREYGAYVARHARAAVRIEAKGAKRSHLRRVV